MQCGLSLPPGVCPKLWLSHGSESSIGEVWRWFDWIERAIFVVLALMLGYTFFVAGRFLRRYYAACRESCALASESLLSSQSGHKRLVAELSRGLATLKSIAAAAPFLGLAGTGYGILAILSTGYGGSRPGNSATIALEVGSALLATGAGLMVAIPAVLSYTTIRARLERFEGGGSSTLVNAVPRSYGFAQTLPLQSRFSGFPAFALIGAPVLGLLVPMFALMLRSPIPVGLPVHLVKVGVGERELPPIIINVVATNDHGRPLLYVNSKETSWDELGITLRSQLEVRPRWVVYVKGEDSVDWAYVAEVVDVARGLHAEIGLLPATSNIESGRVRGAKAKAKAKRVEAQ